MDPSKDPRRCTPGNRRRSELAGSRGCTCASPQRELQSRECSQIGRLTFNVAEAAEQLGVGRGSITNLLARGNLPASRLAAQAHTSVGIAKVHGRTSPLLAKRVEVTSEIDP